MPAGTVLARRHTPHVAGAHRPDARDVVATATVPISVAVLAGDPVTGQGAVAYLASCPGMKVLAADRQEEADVVLILVSWVTEETLEWMQQVADRARHGARFVLVGDGVREQHLLRAVTCGLVSVIPRQEADFERIVHAIRAVCDDRLEMPDVALGWLVRQVRAIQRDVLEPMGVTTAGLQDREADVLRLLAEGLGTAEIAVKLCYSERTVKNIIHGVLTRWQLRNRAHAVAFAMRHGAI
ncbi:helix-turn-helix transcriptional regulator [Catenulispora rubra]|uniref:helix-turn-helix transcriptional regulator n=1 Tax=Catenulispora rubra TaxID=280293 RepID=UPI0018927331|nr:response regulator transcription factor [Catenulispora rubra]